MRPPTFDGLLTLGGQARWAVLSPDGLYRYALGAWWGHPDGVGRLFDVTMLNPSKADHLTNDPTWLKVVHFAKQEKCDGVLVRNIAAWRATDPRELAEVSDPVGPRNAEVLARESFFAVRVAAWGKPPTERIARRLQTTRVQSQIRCNFVLGLTKDGHPRHPLYLPNVTRAALWSDARSALGEGPKARGGQGPDAGSESLPLLPETKEPTR